MDFLPEQGALTEWEAKYDLLIKVTCFVKKYIMFAISKAAEKANAI
jgi:hypothetical protein